MPHIFKPKKFISDNIKVWLDKKEVPRLRAVLLYHKFCGYDSINTEAFFDGLIMPRCYVPSMYARSKKSLLHSGRTDRKIKKVWGVFPTRGDAMKYFFLACMKGYVKWIEVRNKSEQLKSNSRWIYLTDYGKIKQQKFLEELGRFSLDDLDSENNYPLYVIKKSFIEK